MKELQDQQLEDQRQVIKELEDVLVGQKILTASIGGVVILTLDNNKTVMIKCTIDPIQVGTETQLVPVLLTTVYDTQEPEVQDAKLPEASI